MGFEVALALVCFGFGLLAGFVFGHYVGCGVADFRKTEAEINRRNAELDASIARGCRRTDGRI